MDNKVEEQVAIQKATGQKTASVKGGMKIKSTRHSGDALVWGA